MAYNKQDLINQALTAIDTYKLIFIDDVVAMMECSRATFYNHKLEELDAIKEALHKNKTALKVNMRKKWYDSQNPLLQIALMKILATEEEAHRLNGTKIESHQKLTINWHEELTLTEEQQAEFLNEIDSKTKHSLPKANRQKDK